MVQGPNMEFTGLAGRERVAAPPLPSGDKCLEEVCDVAAMVCRGDGAFMAVAKPDGLFVFARSASLRLALPDELPGEVLDGDGAAGPEPARRTGTAGDARGRAAGRGVQTRQVPIWLRKRRFHSVKFVLPEGTEAKLVVGAEDMPRVLTSVQALAMMKLARTAARLVDLEQGAKAAVRKLFETIEATKE